MADISAAMKDWSATTGSNNPSGSVNVGTGLDDNLREIQGSVVRNLHHKGADIASATTTDLGAVEGLFHDITGTTTITGFGTVRAGVWKVIKFEGALTLTHNATSLILPGGANITTADGDTALVVSEGSGNWRCVTYRRANGGVITSATQAEQEAGTSATKPVTPSVQQHHPSAAKAACLADTAGGNLYAYNCDSPTDSGTGDITINFTTDFSSANFAVCASILDANTTFAKVNNRAAGTARLFCLTLAPALADPTVGYSVIAFGDQA